MHDLTTASNRVNLFAQCRASLACVISFYTILCRATFSIMRILAIKSGFLRENDDIGEAQILIIFISTILIGQSENFVMGCIGTLIIKNRIN